MRDTKNKNLAALLAFFGGIVGLQRFYLGQKKLGFFMIFLAIVTMGLASSIIGVIDAIAFLSMNEDKFDYKYNRTEDASYRSRNRPRYKSYERKYKSRKYSDDVNSTVRRDRRMDQHEYKERRKHRERKKAGPYRYKKPKRSSKKTRELRKKALKKIQEHKEKGIEKFKDYDIEGSIVEFQNILKIDPYHIASHFNLACAWSQLEKPDKSMYHLNQAVRAGFDDFNRIRKHDKLAYVRIQPEWEEFSNNGFVFDVASGVMKRDPVSPCFFAQSYIRRPGAL